MALKKSRLSSVSSLTNVAPLPLHILFDWDHDRLYDGNQ
jgi:hypothetical protein